MLTLLAAKIEAAKMEGERFAAEAIGQALCNLIGFTMLEDDEAGKRLGQQLAPTIKTIQAMAGIRYASELDTRLKAEDIFGWSAQFPVRLRDGTRMVADFLVIKNDGTVEIHSCKSKSTKTPLYRRQVKEFKALYPAIAFVEVLKPDWREK